MRILHGPVNVGNQPWTLSRAERARGHRSDLVVNFGTWLGYPADRVMNEVGDNTPANRRRRLTHALTAPFRYDVIHYYFGQGFLLWADFGEAYKPDPAENKNKLWDVRLARRLGRHVFMTLQGCDARIAGKSFATNAVTMCKPDGCPAYATCRSDYDAHREAMIAQLLPLMDRVFYLNPELGHFVPNGTFLPYANVDIAAQNIVLPRTDRRPRIVHAPSSGAIKGTPMILAALDRLKDRFGFELLLIENKPHAEAMELYRDADLAIDQIQAGWYGGFAVELMAMGKPVAAYIRDEDCHFVPKEMLADLPIVRLDPRTLDDDLARILAAPETLPDLGRQSRRFVERWHDPARIAAALERIYADPAAPLDLGAPLELGGQSG